MDRIKLDIDVHSRNKFLPIGFTLRTWQALEIQMG